MRNFLAIAETGLAAVFLQPVRSVATVVALVVVLVPFLTGLAMSRGMQDQGEAAVRQGADLYVTGEQFGRPAAIPAESAEAINRLPGVRDARPRIVGRIELGKERVSAVVVGVAIERFPPEVECIEGRLYKGGPRNELVVGSDLAHALNIKIGSFLPPFYHSRNGEHVSEVVGIFRSDVSPWQSRLILTSFETAALFFDQPGLATDVLVYCDRAYIDKVRTAIQRDIRLGSSDTGPRPRVQDRDEAASLLAKGPMRREGILTLMSVFAFAVAILVVLVTSGFGLAERRREVGILKATGWQTDEVLLRSLVESLVLGIAAAALGILLAFVWLAYFNGYGIAGLFYPGLENAAHFQIPFRLGTGPVSITLMISLIIVVSGSLHATWRAAIARPAEVMR